VDNAHLIIDAVKRAEDSNAIIVRLYECHGARGVAYFNSSLPVKSVARTNLLEEVILSFPWVQTGFKFDFTPFEIITLKLEL
jgi:alpha-mannosidase